MLRAYGNADIGPMAAGYLGLFLAGVRCYPSAFWLRL